MQSKISFCLNMSISRLRIFDPWIFSSWFLPASRWDWSSLRNIRLNTFRVVLVLWSLLPNRTFFSLFLVPMSFHLHKNFFEQLWRRKEKESPLGNRLHNTKTTWNVFNIILWRLLLATLKSDVSGDRVSGILIPSVWEKKRKYKVYVSFCMYISLIDRDNYKYCHITFL